MKTLPLFFCSLLIFVACKKHNDSNQENQQTNQVTVPSAPDTLGAGWTKEGIIPIDETVTDVFFADLNTGYATTTKGVYKSGDGGVNWGKISSWGNYINIAANGPNVCFVSGTSTIFFSSDYAVNIHEGHYDNATPGGPAGFQDCFFSSNNVCYAASRLYLWKSIDGGTTFDTLYNFNDVNNPVVVSLYFADDLNGWASRNYSLFKTTDGGVHWNSNKTLANKYGPVSFIDINNGFIADKENLFKTSNAGSTWEPMNTAPGTDTIIDLHFFTPLRGYYTAGTKIYKTTDGGTTWTTVVALGEKKLVEVFFLDEHHGWACGQYGYILRFNL